MKSKNETQAVLALKEDAARALRGLLKIGLTNRKERGPTRERPIKLKVV